jgi:hypothetical protein
VTRIQRNLPQKKEDRRQNRQDQAKKRTEFKYFPHYALELRTGYLILENKTNRMTATNQPGNPKKNTSTP